MTKSITRLLNGTAINIPNQEGAYILSTGCGSGKTTMYKYLIKRHWREGVLYSVDSRKECIAMYEWLTGERIKGLKSSDIFMMFTKEENSTIQIMADDNLKKYKQNPEILLDKKVVIIPHPRLFSDIPSYFLIYHPSKTSIPQFDGNFQSLMTRDDLRQWILIDETPQFFKPLAVLPGWMPALMEGKDIKKTYDSVIKGRDYDPFKVQDTKLARLKKDTVWGMLPNLIPGWIGKQQDSYKIQFYPKDLVQPGMKTHLYLAEGVGDVLFSGQRKFQLFDVNPKYKSKLELKSIPFGLDRKNVPGEAEKKTFFQTLKGIIDGESDPVLIVVWKDFHNCESDLSCSDDSSGSAWRDSVKAELVNLGVPEEKFFVTYYGATDTKSTNDYRNCGSIVCCGKWFLPVSASDKLNQGYDGDCDVSDYNLYQYIQLVCRIGLRNNTGQTYRLYYSRDFEEKGKFSLGNRLADYINNNKFSPVGSDNDKWKKICETIPNGKKQIDSIEKIILAGHLDSQKLSHESQSLSLPLKEMARVVPRSKKPRKDDYNNLQKVLAKLDVTLTIT